MNTLPAAPPDMAISSHPPFCAPPSLAAQIEQLIGRYPQKRSASLMVLHAVQQHLGYLSREAMEWAAAQLELQPINIYELATFYPMFRLQPAGRYHLKICRTLSCALAGSHPLRKHICQRLHLDEQVHGVQTTPDGRYSLEFVECLASCGSGPVLMVNDEFYERVTPEKADEILAHLNV